MSEHHWLIMFRKCSWGPGIHIPCVSFIATRKLPGSSPYEQTLRCTRKIADSTARGTQTGKSGAMRKNSMVFTGVYQMGSWVSAILWEFPDVILCVMENLQCIFFFSKCARNLPTHLTQKKSIAWMSFCSYMLSGCKGAQYFFLNCTFFIELWQIILRQMGKDPLSTAENS